VKISLPNTITLILIRKKIERERDTNRESRISSLVRVLIRFEFGKESSLNFLMIYEMIMSET